MVEDIDTLRKEMFQLYHDESIKGHSRVQAIEKRMRTYYIDRGCQMTLGTRLRSVPYVKLKKLRMSIHQVYYSLCLYLREFGNPYLWILLKVFQGQWERMSFW